MKVEALCLMNYSLVLESVAPSSREQELSNDLTHQPARLSRYSRKSPFAIFQITLIEVDGKVIHREQRSAQGLNVYLLKFEQLIRVLRWQSG